MIGLVSNTSQQDRKQLRSGLYLLLSYSVMTRGNTEHSTLYSVTVTPARPPRRAPTNGLRAPHAGGRRHHGGSHQPVQRLHPSP